MAERQRMAAIYITSPLEPEYVEQICAVDPDRVDVMYDADLLPPTRYIADHNGRQDFSLTDEQQKRRLALLERANVLWDFPTVEADGPGILDLVPNLKWTQTTSAGVGPLVDRLGLANSDVIVTTASGVHARPLAEFVFMALLIHVKCLDRIQRDQIRCHWERFCSDELDGKTMAIIGPGRIGRQVATIAKAFGMRVTVMGRNTSEERRLELGVDAIYPRERLHEMLAEADAVVLSCPHTPETENMIDTGAFRAMKDGVMFVNIARGQVVNEPALLDALRSGKIGFAALDVFATEPLPPDSPFWDLPNVLVCPHSGSTSTSENRKITEIFCHNLRCFLDGRDNEMCNVLDKALLY